jgi:protein O-GlcNAc transferase
VAKMFVEFVEFDQCPLCGGDEASVAHVADVTHHPCFHVSLSPTITWLSCDRCGHSFRQGFYTEQALELVFRSTPEHQEVGFDIEQQRPVSARLVERVLPHVPPDRRNGRWLDVGFGNASLLFTAAEFGFEPVGCDLRPRNVEMLRFFDVEAECADVTELCVDQVTVVSMNDVLEHVPYPVEALRAAHRLLEPGGVLLVSAPNAESVLWRVLDMAGVNPYWGELEHYHNFGRVSLYTLLRRCGFEPVSYGVSERYRCGMEVVAVRDSTLSV